MPPLYTPLFPESGGQPKAFLCSQGPRCKDVTRTRKGMVLHLWRKHKVKVQLKMDFQQTSEEELAWLDK
jgi:hypothetical protein